MLFQDKQLQSNFDIDYELSDDMATLNLLCKENAENNYHVGHIA